MYPELYKAASITNFVDKIKGPVVTSLRDKWDMSDTLINGKRPNNAIKYCHLWKARIPKNLPEGDHTLIVRVTDMFGREFFDEYHYRIENR
ncbi:hypothetical protein [Gracilimonas amylolytica]|uniref:hypothetical protein n=1 Tax=Gracilimonas amylolytica TaxID=1749045 RepID=UPI0012FFDF02|nr:hypothetical protein [Gracilimonas amylolytica]